MQSTLSELSPSAVPFAEWRWKGSSMEKANSSRQPKDADIGDLQGQSGKKHRTFSWFEASLSDRHRLEAIYLLMGGDDRLLHFVFDLDHPRLRLPANELLKQTQGWSRGEIFLVQAAIEFWTGSSCLRLGEAISRWDEINITRFIRALCHLCEIRNSVMHGLIDDENGGFCL